MVIPPDSSRHSKADSIGTQQVKKIESAIRQIGAHIDFGLLNGRDNQRLANELNIAIRTVEGFGSLPRWRPHLDMTGGVRTLPFELVIPEERLDRHREVMELSYLIRAFLDWHIQEVLPDGDERNACVRRFTDLVMFGSPLKSSARLERFGSLKEVHNSGVPITLVLGYMSRFRPATSGIVETFKTFTPYHAGEDGLVKPMVSAVTRRIGNGPSGFDFYMRLRQAGLVCKYGIRREHVVEPDGGEEPRSLVAVSRQVDDILHEETGEPLVAVSRTVVWTGNRDDFGSMFSEGPKFLH